jgi:hypothetical protein
MIAMMHAAPTAPDPTTPTFMQGPSLPSAAVEARHAAMTIKIFWQKLIVESRRWT